MFHERLLAVPQVSPSVLRLVFVFVFSMYSWPASLSGRRVLTCCIQNSHIATSCRIFCVRHVCLFGLRYTPCTTRNTLINQLIRKISIVPFVLRYKGGRIIGGEAKSINLPSHPSGVSTPYGFPVVRIDLLHFRAGYRMSRLNQAYSVIS